jgi:hypothetical protein
MKNLHMQVLNHDMSIYVGHFHITKYLHMQKILHIPD